jgi:hypothetical protein
MLLARLCGDIGRSQGVRIFQEMLETAINEQSPFHGHSIKRILSSSF